MSLAWAYLLAAGLCEIGWPVGFKLSQQPEFRFWGVTGAVVSMALSGWLLWLAQREIPLGTAYAVWTGIGAVGTAILGIFLFGESTDMARLASIGLIVAGIIGLKFTSAV